MPESIPIASFVLGGVLLLIAVVGGRFKIFGAEVSEVVRGPGRFVAGVLGVILIGFGIFASFPSHMDDDRAKKTLNVNLPSAQWRMQAPYSGECGTRPAGTVCAGFDDGYVWLVMGSVSGWEKRVEGGQNIQVAISGKRRYEHILGTNEVRIVDR